MLQEHRREARLRQRSSPTRFRARARLIREQVVTTFMTWEGTTRDDISLPRPQTGKLSLDFERGKDWNNRSSSVHDLTAVEDSIAERQASAGSSR